MVCEHRDAARNGETVVALLDDGDATLKKFYKEGNRVRLQPANARVTSLFSPISVRIQGVVMGVIRSCR